MMANSPNNSFVEDGILYLVPTYTADIIGKNAVFDGFTYNITGCTNTNISACGAVSKALQSQSLTPSNLPALPPSTPPPSNTGASRSEPRSPQVIGSGPRFGCSPYKRRMGPWPLSGEIDIMEARGNSRAYPAQGVDYVRASLNWGPLTWLNEVFRTFGWWQSRRRTFDQEIHTYVLEWSDKIMWFFVCRGKGDGLLRWFF